MKKPPFCEGFEMRLAANFKGKCTRFLKFLQDYFNSIGEVAGERMEHFCARLKGGKDE